MPRSSKETLIICTQSSLASTDPELSLEMMELLERVSQTGITVLVVTHEHELVHRFHQRVVTLKNGRIISDIPACRRILRWCWRVLCRAWGALAGFVRGIPLVWRTAVGCCVIGVLLFALESNHADGLLLTTISSCTMWAGAGILPDFNTLAKSFACSGVK